MFSQSVQPTGAGGSQYEGHDSSKSLLRLNNLPTTSTQLSIFYSMQYTPDFFQAITRKSSYSLLAIVFYMIKQKKGVALNGVEVSLCYGLSQLLIVYDIVQSLTTNCAKVYMLIVQTFTPICDNNTYQEIEDLCNEMLSFEQQVGIFGCLCGYVQLLVHVCNSVQLFCALRCNFADFKMQIYA